MREDARIRQKEDAAMDAFHDARVEARLARQRRQANASDKDSSDEEAGSVSLPTKTPPRHSTPSRAPSPPASVPSPPRTVPTPPPYEGEPQVAEGAGQKQGEEGDAGVAEERKEGETDKKKEGEEEKGKEDAPVDADVGTEDSQEGTTKGPKYNGQPMLDWMECMLGVYQVWILLGRWGCKGDGRELPFENAKKKPERRQRRGSPVSVNWTYHAKNLYIYHRSHAVCSRIWRSLKVISWRCLRTPISSLILCCTMCLRVYVGGKIVYELHIIEVYLTQFI